MAALAAIDEIEADLRFCENVLNSQSRVNLGQPCRVGSAGTVPAQHAACAVTGVHIESVNCRPLSKQQLLSKPAQMAPAAAAKARTTEELLAMMSSMPAGQPFEIDADLLYSPQSSRSGGGHGSPGARCCSHDSLAWEELLHQQAAGDAAADVSLAAYRPAELYERSQQHAAGPPPCAQQPHRRGSGGTGSAARSPRGPHSDQRTVPASALNTGGSAASSARRPGRQLKLDDAAPDSVPADGGDLLRQARDGRLTQLAHPRTGLWQQCARAKELEDDAQLRECTFQPKTGRPPSRQRLAPGVPVEERLALSQAGRHEALERARVEKEREQLADCTFAPKLVTKPQRHLREEYTPLHQRVGQEQKQRSAKLSQAQLQRDLSEADLTFQPQLNPRSLQLAAERETRELFGEQPANRRPAGASALRGGTAQSSPTFAPAINAASEQLLADSATMPSDFQERLRFYARRSHARQQAAAEAAAAEACSFRPDTGNAVQVLALSASRAGNLAESEAERCERMAGREAARIGARRAAKEAELYGELRFAPQLNPRSTALAPAGSGGLQGLADAADRQRQRLSDLRQAEEQRQRAECTFQPDTSKPRVRGYYDEYRPPQPSAPLSIAHAAKQRFEGLTQSIASYRAVKEARAAAAREQERAEALAECSFAPDINRRRVQAQARVVVRGLERYMELKQLSERQRAEAADRAAKVFNLRPRAKQGATVPEPFQLAGHALLEAKAAEKQAALLESTLSERLRDCTFKPRTNQQQQQQLLQRLLDPSSDAAAVAAVQL